MVMHARKLPRIDDGYYDCHDYHELKNNKLVRDRRIRDDHSLSSDRQDSPTFRHKHIPADRRKPERDRRDKYYQEYEQTVKENSRHVENSTNQSDRLSSNHLSDHRSVDTRTDNVASVSRLKDKDSQAKFEDYKKSSSSKPNSSGSTKDPRVEAQKTALRVCGDWSEHVSSSGKKYFYNCKTEVSQWVKPKEWKSEESTKPGRVKPPSTASSKGGEEGCRNGVVAHNEHTDSSRLRNDKSSEDVQRSADSDTRSRVSELKCNVYQKSRSSSEATQNEQTLASRDVNNYQTLSRSHDRSSSVTSTPSSSIVDNSNGSPGTHVDKTVSMDKLPLCNGTNDGSGDDMDISPDMSPKPECLNSNDQNSNIRPGNLLANRKPDVQQSTNPDQSMIWGKALQTLQTLQEVLERSRSVSNQTVGNSTRAAVDSPRSVTSQSPKAIPLSAQQHSTTSEIADPLHSIPGDKSPVSEASLGQHSALSSAAESCSSVNAILPQSLFNYYDPTLLGHISNWPAEQIEHRAHLAYRDGLVICGHHCGQVSTELKRDRSHVRIAEVQSTLIEHSGVKEEENRNFQFWSETRSILDSLGQVEGISSTRHQGIGYSPNALFSQPAQVLSTRTDRESKAWVAPSTKRRQAAPSATDRQLNNASPVTFGNGSVYHRARGILNKLTPERFDKLSLELLNVGIDSELTLRGLIILIFDKAVDEPKFSSLYAQLCERLSKDAPNFEPPQRKVNTFYRLLLTKCQDEFESRAKITSESTNINFTTEEEYEEFAITKRKMLGNIRFIGELGKLEVVNEGILHKCIQQLLEKKKTLSLTDQAEDLECLCQIMKTVGKRLDTTRAKLWMDQYFDRMASVLTGGEMPPRIKFMIQGVIDMRKNGWSPRKVATELTPKTIGEIRQGFAHTKTDTSMFSRTAPGAKKNADADLFDIFGAPMASKSAGHSGLMGDMHRPGSPSSSRNNYGRQDPGWKDGPGIEKEKDRAEWDGYRERDHMMREKEMREKSDYMAAKSRDFAPRYNSKTLSSLTSADKLSLRPGANIRPSFKPSSPHYLPKSARSTNSTPAEPVLRESRIFTKPQTPVIIKQEPKQKSKKQSEQKSGSKADGDVSARLLDACAALWTCNDVGETCAEISNMLKNSGVKTVQTKTVRQIIKQALNEKDTSCLLRLTSLLSLLSEGGYMDEQAVEKILVDFVDEAERLETRYPDIKLRTAELLYSAVSMELIKLPVVCKLFINGAGHPLALQFLKSLHGQKGEDWLTRAFNEHNLSCIKLLPVSSQSDSGALAILEEYGLLCLEPMLDIQRSIWEQINEDPNPSSLFKWILKNIDEASRLKSQFTFALFKSLLRYIASETSMKEGTDFNVLPSKQTQELEKQTFMSYQEILLRFLHDSAECQAMALYSLQVFCHENNFPKGMMLRMFTYLYDLEIVDEEVFLKWKEDIKEQYPGKGKALFQVNQWLTWLEQAESESDED